MRRHFLRKHSRGITVPNLFPHDRQSYVRHRGPREGFAVKQVSVVFASRGLVLMSKPGVSCGVDVTDYFSDRHVVIQTASHLFVESSFRKPETPGQDHLLAWLKGADMVIRSIHCYRLIGFIDEGLVGDGEREPTNR